MNDQSPDRSRPWRILGAAAMIGGALGFLAHKSSVRREVQRVQNKHEAEMRRAQQHDDKKKSSAA